MTFLADKTVTTEQLLAYYKAWHKVPFPGNCIWCYYAVEGHECNFQPKKSKVAEAMGFNEEQRLIKSREELEKGLELIRDSRRILEERKAAKQARDAAGVEDVDDAPL